MTLCAPVPVASFDVFETVLVRTVGEPQSVFRILGCRAAQNDLVTLAPDSFQRARRDAERRARRRRGDLDPTLDEVYAELAAALGLNDACRDRLQELELEIEAELLRAVPGVAVELSERRRRGQRIVFVSDSYVPAAWLQRQLEDRGLLHPGERLFVSNACDGATKRSGTLMRLVCEELGVPPSTVVHYGNDRLADGQAPARAGVEVRLRPQGNLNRYEQALEATAIATAGVSSVLAGTSRLTRLSVPAADARDAVLRDVVAGVAAPTLVSFIASTLRQALACGRQRLYFLAREGQVLLEIAAILTRRLELPLELRYLYVSRQALNAAALRVEDEEDAAWALTYAETNSVRTLLERLGVDLAAEEPVLRASGFPSATWDEVPDADQRRTLLAAVRHGGLRDASQNGLRRRRDLALTYLRGAGFFDDVAVGVVDSSGAGSQLRALDRLRREAGLTSVRGWLFYRMAGPGQHDDAAIPAMEVTGWYEDAAASRGLGVPPGRAALLEVFCAADHGTVLDYRADSDEVAPVLSATDAPATAAWGLDLLRETMRCFAETVPLGHGGLDGLADTRHSAEAVLRLLWEHPSRAEAAVWGCSPLESSSGRELEAVRLADPYALSDVLRAVRRGAVSDRHWGTWRAASEQLSPPASRGLLRAARWAKRQVRR